MKNSMNNFLIPEIPQVKEQPTTTLVIDEVPSEIACDILFKEGRIASREEVMARIRNEEAIHISSSDFFDTIKEMVRLREVDNFDHFYQITNNRDNSNRISSTNADLIEMAGAKPENEEEIRATEIVQEHQPSNWQVNPDNPNEEIQVCLDCGIIMNRREINARSYAGTSSTNEELIKMLQDEPENEEEIRATEIVQEHQPSNWQVNPDNPNEEIQVCLDCGIIMNRREINVHSYAGISSTNVENTQMLHVTDGDESHHYDDEPSKPGLRL